MSRRRQGRQEIARQDVLVTRNGPIELYRRDQNGNEIRVPRDQLKYISSCDRQQRDRHQYNPVQSRHGPGLYRNFSTVKGDSLRLRKPTRTFVYHRAAFDWYNSNRFDLIDDIEEVLEPRTPRYEVRDERMHGYYSDYDDRSCSRGRNSSRSKSRSCPRRKVCCESESEEEEVIYVVKKKENKPKKKEDKPVEKYSIPYREEAEAPAPVYSKPIYTAPVTESVVYEEPKTEVYTAPIIDETVNYTQAATYEKPKTVNYDEIIYHGSSNKTVQKDPYELNKYGTKIYDKISASNVKAYDTSKVVGSDQIIYHGNQTKQKNYDETKVYTSRNYNQTNAGSTKIYDTPKTVNSNQVIYHGAKKGADTYRTENIQKGTVTKKSNIDLKQMLKDLETVSLSYK